MKFRFEFDIKKLPWPVDHLHQLLLIGSCFTENIAAKLSRYKFRVLENPHGILFNPICIADAVDDYIENKNYQTKDLFCLNESWHSWKHHSRFSAPSPEEAVEKINESIALTHKFLLSADYLFLTLGSAWVYKLSSKADNPSAVVVAANNHKAPADWFERQLLQPAALTERLQQMIEALKLFNPRLKLIFTISPVRHLREGAIDNNRSKAVLIQVVHQLVEQHDHLYYFPAYELVLDDLRDYRFYAEDLVHPNYFATEYVWERLTESCINEKARQLMTEIHAINLAFQHKPLNPASQQHQNFLNHYFRKTLALQQQHPHLNFDIELAYFKSGAS